MDLVQLAKYALEVYLKEKRILTLPELHLNEKVNLLLDTKDAIFVTLYTKGTVVASSGRIHPVKKNTVLELIDNALACLSDSRIANELDSLEDFSSVSIRVDHLAGNTRKVIGALTEIDPLKHGLIFLSQKFETAAVLLPKISTVATTAEDLFYLVVKKAGLEPVGLDEDDYILYTFETEVTTDF